MNKPYKNLQYSEQRMIVERQARRRETNLQFISCSRHINTNARITNLSTAGAFIETSKPLPIDAELDLHFQLPRDPEVISIVVCVVWTTSIDCPAPAGMGIQFKKILPKHQKKLAAFLT